MTATTHSNELIQLKYIAHSDSDLLVHIFAAIENLVGLSAFKQVQDPNRKKHNKCMVSEMYDIFLLKMYLKNVNDRFNI